MWATSIGSTFSHSPVPGERKSGIPDGTEIPAPVSATTERAVRTARRSAELAVGRQAAGERPARRTRRPTAPPEAPRIPAVSSPGSAVRVCPGTPRCPPWRRSLANTAANARFSAAMPSSRSPAARHALDLADRERRLAGELARPLQGGVEQLVIVDEAVDEPELVRFVGEHRVADEVHLQGLVGAHQPRQPLRAAEAGDDPELDLGLAEHRRARGDAHVAGHRQLAAAAEREPVDGGDRGDALGPSSRNSAWAASIICAPRGLVHRGERLDVGARAEQEGVRRGDHERAHRRTPLDARPHLAEVLDHLRRDRVHLAVGQPRDRDAVAALSSLTTCAAGCSASGCG